MVDSEIQNSNIMEPVCTGATYDADECPCENFVGMMLLLLVNDELFNGGMPYMGDIL